jgi:hypothetical protein
MGIYGVTIRHSELVSESQTITKIIYVMLKQVQHDKDIGTIKKAAVNIAIMNLPEVNAELIIVYEK